MSEISEWEGESPVKRGDCAFYAASAAGENATAKGDSQPAALPQEHQEKEESESTGGRKEKEQLKSEGCFFLSVAWENRTLPVLREKQFTKVDCFFREREARASKTGQRRELRVSCLYVK